MYKVIAVVGMPGSGKSEVSKFLAGRGFVIVHFGDATMDELRRRKLPVNETNERTVREQLRKEHGMNAYAKLNLPKINAALKSSNVVADGVYSFEEYLYLKEKLGDKFIVIAVHASPKTRYQRLAKRLVRPLTADECTTRDLSEIQNLNKGGTIAMADFMISNEDTKSALQRAVASFLEEIE